MARRATRAVYFQRIAPGEPVSILCLCDGREARALGSSRQWAAPAPGEPFRFGGCVRPAGLPAQIGKQLVEAAASPRRRRWSHRPQQLRFSRRGRRFCPDRDQSASWRDPRYFRSAPTSSRRMSTPAAAFCPPPRSNSRARAAAQIAYARRDIAAMPAFDWPDWTADRPRTARRAALVRSALYH